MVNYMSKYQIIGSFFIFDFWILGLIFCDRWMLNFCICKLMDVSLFLYIE